MSDNYFKKRPVEDAIQWIFSCENVIDKQDLYDFKLYEKDEDRIKQIADNLRNKMIAYYTALPKTERKSHAIAKLIPSIPLSIPSGPSEHSEISPIEQQKQKVEKKKCLVSMQWFSKIAFDEELKETFACITQFLENNVSAIDHISLLQDFTLRVHFLVNRGAITQKDAEKLLDANAETSMDSLVQYFQEAIKLFDKETWNLVELIKNTRLRDRVAYLLVHVYSSKITTMEQLIKILNDIYLFLESCVSFRKQVVQKVKSWWWTRQLTCDFWKEDKQTLKKIIHKVKQVS
jgi:hypothetical protein